MKKLFVKNPTREEKVRTRTEDIARKEKRRGKRG